MRVALIVLTLWVVATPSGASPSCMSRTEAHQHFGSAHIHWSGVDHCWKATPTRYHYVYQRKHNQSKWRDALSEILPYSQPIQTAENTSADAHSNRNDLAGSVDWLDRWVDIVQVAPPMTILKRRTDQMVALARHSENTVIVVLALVALALVLCTIEVLFRRTIQN